MRTWRTGLGCALLALAATSYADNKTDKADKTKTAMKSDAVMVNASDLKWSAAPPDLPKGAQLAVLHGDPTKATQFAMRLKVPDGYKVPPHWHTNDEELTIISGTLVLHMGDTMTADPHSLDAGAYHFLPGKMHHAAEAKGATIVQINGMGPFDIHYLNAADNPNPKAAMR